METEINIICQNCGVSNKEPIDYREYDGITYGCCYLEYRCFYCGGLIKCYGVRSHITKQQLKKIIERDFWKSNKEKE